MYVFDSIKRTDSWNSFFQKLDNMHMFMNLRKSWPNIRESDSYSKGCEVESWPGRDCRWGEWMSRALSTFNIMTRCPWARHQTSNCSPAPQHKWLLTSTGVCSRCVCVFTVCVFTWMGKCRAWIQSMAHHTWLYVMSLSSICIQFNTEAPQEVFVWELDWWLVAQDPFDSLKWSDSWEAFVEKPDYFGCTLCLWFTKKNRLTSGIDYELNYICCTICFDPLNDTNSQEVYVRYRLTRGIHSGTDYWLCSIILIHRHLFRNWTILVMQFVFDSLKRTDSQEAFVQDSFYTGHAMCFWFTKTELAYERHLFNNWLHWLRIILLIYWKKLIHERYLFRNRTTLVE